MYLDSIANIQQQYGYRLKIKNESLTEDMLLTNGFEFEMNNGLFNIVLHVKDDAEHIANLLPNKYSEMFLIEQPSIEEIFKFINGESIS